MSQSLITPIFSLSRLLAVISFLLVSLLADTTAQGQNAAARRAMQQQQQLQKRIQDQMKKAAENAPALPSDPELLSLHRDFILKADKLALEYERKKEFEKARDVYESLIRLVPKYKAAEAGLDRILTAQSTRDRKLTKVLANKAWQDTGARLQQSMPVVCEVKGTWNVVLKTGAEGVEIPSEIKPRDSRIKLGTLIGVIVNSPADLEKPKTFVIKSGTKFVAEKSGRLYLRMFDIDPTDNDGELYVSIQSTFSK